MGSGFRLSWVGSGPRFGAWVTGWTESTGLVRVRVRDFEFNLNGLIQIKSHSQVLAFEIKLRGTPQFNFHTNSHNKINQNQIRIKQGRAK